MRIFSPRNGATACAALLFGTCTAQIESLDTSDPASITNAAKLIATDMMAYYIGDQPGQTPGYLPGNGQVGGYFWWIGGGMFGSMVDYWYFTGDDTWNDKTIQAITFQSDPSSGGYFDSQNVSFQLGNDDQAFWAFAAMDAAEYKFPNPPDDYPSWVAMAQGVFNQQVQRWDDATCGGGLRWQAVFTNAGYNYKNSVSNGALFQLAARLGKYTGNHTYTDWAIKTYDWSVSANLVLPDQNWVVIDGIFVDTCTTDGGTGDSRAQWTYNVGLYLYGAAAMWNITQSDPYYANQSSLWQDRVEGFLNGSAVFFITGNETTQPVLTEVICEPYALCSIDASTFKAWTARWMRATAKVAPFAAERIANYMADSPTAAAAACNAAGQNGGAMCGQQWYLNPAGYDGRSGIGMQLNALETIMTLLPSDGPVSEAAGISQSDSSAGSEPIYNPGVASNSGVINVTTADRAGAWIIFLILTGLTLAGGWWIVADPGFAPQKLGSSVVKRWPGSAVASLRKGKAAG